MRKRFKVFKRKYVAQHRARVKNIKRITRKPVFAIPVVTTMALLAVVAVGGLLVNRGKPTLSDSDSHIVIVSHDHREQTVPTRAKTVGDLLPKIGVALNKGDVVEPTADTPIVEDNFRINVYRASPVTVIDGSNQVISFSAAATPRSIVKQVGISIYPEDVVQLAPTQNFVTQHSIGARVVVTRATPLNLNLYGTPYAIRTQAKTVGDLLEEKKVHLIKDDTVQPSLDTPISANMQVFVIRKGNQIISEQQDIPAPVQVVEDASLSFGTKVVRQQGVPGKKVVTYQIQLQNGHEVARQQIQEVITQQPVTQVEAHGKAVQIPSDKQGVMRLAGISEGDFAYVDYIVSHESGWCPTKLQGQYGGCPASAPASIPSGLGYGLGQATPGSKMAPFGSDWQVNAVTQLKWATSYAGRYGGWAGAYNHWVANHNW